MQGLSEPKDGLLQDKSLFVANALVYGINGEIPLICLNISDRDITLQKGTLLAYLKPIDLGERVHRVNCYIGPEETFHNEWGGDQPNGDSLNLGEPKIAQPQNWREYLNLGEPKIAQPQNSREYLNLGNPNMA